MQWLISFLLVTSILGNQIELQHDKTNKMTCAPSEDSDRSEHLPSLICLRCPHEETSGP